MYWRAERFVSRGMRPGNGSCGECFVTNPKVYEISMRRSSIQTQVVLLTTTRTKTSTLKLRSRLK